MKTLLKLALMVLLGSAMAVQAATAVIGVSAGYEHGLFLKADGSLWAMGGNNDGQLGNGLVISYSEWTNRPVESVSNVNSW
jgi:alpha-tubulin suppressor-like RCC1 family protein